SGAVLLERERQEAQVLDQNEAGGAVEMERAAVAGLCLDRQADGPGINCCLANSLQQRPPGPAALGASHDVEVRQLPKAVQPLGCGDADGGRQASQLGNSDPTRVSADAQMWVICAPRVDSRGLEAALAMQSGRRRRRIQWPSVTGRCADRVQLSRRGSTGPQRAGCAEHGPDHLRLPATGDGELSELAWSRRR